MAGDKKLVALFELQTGASKQNLDELRAAEKAMSAEGVTAATSMSNGFEMIETRSASMFAKIQNGSSVSDSQLRSLAAQYVALGDSVTGAFGSIESAPEAIQSAMKIAEDQVLAVNTAVVSMGDRVVDAAERFKTLAVSGRDAAKVLEDSVTGATAAIETLGTSGDAAATGVAGGADAAATSLEAVSAAAGTAAASVEEITAASGRAALPLPDVKRGFVSIAEAAQNMAESVDRGWSRDEEGGRESSRALVEVLQNRLRLKEAIIEEFGAMENADAATRAAYEAWDVEVQRLTVHVQEMVAVQRQATVATKEGGEQFATIGLLAEQAGKHFGETGEKIGSVAGQLGLMAAMSEHLKRSFEGLKLNELEGGFARTAIQVAAVAATAAVAVEVGLKMAEADDQNAESVRNLVHELEHWVSIDLAANLRASDAELQVLLSDMIAAATGAKDFFVAFNTGDYDGAIKAVESIRNSFKGYTAEVEAATAASNRRAIASHTAATADQIAAQFAQENAAMSARVAVATDQARIAADKRTASQQHLTTVMREGATADEIAAQKAAEIAERVAHSAELIAKAKETEAKNARAVVEGIKESAKATDDESEKTKQSIETATKLAKAKETEATAAKLAAEGLKEAATQAKEVAKQTQEAATASAHLTAMLTALIDAVNEETGAHGRKQTAIEKEIAKLEEELKINGNLSASEKARIADMIAVASHINGLQKEEDAFVASKKQDVAATDAQVSASHRHSEALKATGEDLQREIDETGSLYIAQHRQAEAEAQIIVVKSGRAAQIQAEIDLGKAQLDAINAQTDATNRVSAATSKSTIIQQDATGVITNLTKASGDASAAAANSTVHYDEVTHSMTNVKEAASKVEDGAQGIIRAIEETDPFLKQFDDAMTKAGVEIVPRFGESISVTASKMTAANPQVAAHVLEVDKLKVSYGNVTTELSGVHGQLEAIVEQLRQVKTHAEDAQGALSKMASVVTTADAGASTRTSAAGAK
jgi:hypothetical protein